MPGRQNEKARQLTSRSFGVPLGCVSLLTLHLFEFFDRERGNQLRVYRSLALFHHKSEKRNLPSTSICSNHSQMRNIRLHRPPLFCLYLQIIQRVFLAFSLSFVQFSKYRWMPNRLKDFSSGRSKLNLLFRRSSGGGW